NAFPVAIAPSAVLQNRKFFRAITKGLTVLSAIYAEFKINSLIPNNLLSPTFLYVHRFCIKTWG
ncbi:MAG: hypothetical protein SPJ17_05365, partial [Anaeroplasma sp.]|uniref:hypothetical protein n=1 Tax=Anaeroplasma sp. TaxID=1872523 RepID=UPI002A91365C